MVKIGAHLRKLSQKIKQGYRFLEHPVYTATYRETLAVGGTAIHCPNEWTLNPQSATRQTHLFPNPSPHNVLRQRLTIVVASIAGY